MTRDHVYPEVCGNRIDSQRCPPPVFPAECPACGAASSGGEHVGSPWVTHDYVCGGGYKPKPQIQNHTDYWWGYCPKTKRAEALGLDRHIPEPMLEDAERDAGLRD